MITAEPATATHRPHLWRGVLAVAVLLAVFVGALPHIATYGEVWAHIRAMDIGGIAVVAVSATWNIVTYWFLLIAALPGLTMRQAAISNQASTAVSNTVPAGGAVGAALTWAMYRRWGFTNQETGRALLVASVWTNAFKLALPLVAFVLAATVHGDDETAPLAVGLASMTVLGAAFAVVAGSLRSSTAARRIGRGAASVVSVMRRNQKDRHSDWADRADEIRRNCVDLVADRWLWLTAATVVSQVSLFVALLASIRGVGIDAAELPWTSALAGFALVRVALVVPITPGGAGVAELGLTGALIAAGGPDAEVVAAVLLFRGLTWLLPIGLGGLAYMLWLREMTGAE